MEINGKAIDLGVYIDGSLQNPTEGIERAIECARELLTLIGGNPDNIESTDKESVDHDSGDYAQSIYEELEDLESELSIYLPDYVYAGWMEGDWGIWADLETVEIDANNPHEMSVIKVADTPSYILHINDHGNATLYKVELTEVWSVV